MSAPLAADILFLLAAASSCDYVYMHRLAYAKTHMSICCFCTNAISIAISYFC